MVTTTSLVWHQAYTNSHYEIKKHVHLWNESLLGRRCVWASRSHDETPIPLPARDCKVMSLWHLVICCDVLAKNCWSVRWKVCSSMSIAWRNEEPRVLSCHSYEGLVSNNDGLGVSGMCVRHGDFWGCLCPWELGYRSVDADQTLLGCGCIWGAFGKLSFVWRNSLIISIIMIQQAPVSPLEKEKWHVHVKIIFRDKFGLNSKMCMIIDMHVALPNHSRTSAIYNV